MRSKWQCAPVFPLYLELSDLLDVLAARDFVGGLQGALKEQEVSANSKMQVCAEHFNQTGCK